MRYSAAERKLAQVILAAFPFGQTVTPPPISGEEWPMIARLADRHGLLPLLHMSVEKLGPFQDTPRQVRDSLHDAYWRSAVGNSLVMEELKRLLDLFQSVRIPVVVLKGCALAAWLYPTEGSRPFSDIDLLVSSADKDRARSLVMENGWLFDPGSVDFRRSFLGQESYQKKGPLPVELELHWHVLDLPYYIQKVPMEWFWERTVAREIQGRSALVFAPTAQGLHLCVHLGIHHPEARLIWSYDLALLLAHHCSEINWHELAQAMRNFQVAGVVRDCLEDVQNIWGVGIPAHAHEEITGVRPRFREVLAARSMLARQMAAGPAWDGLVAPGMRNWKYWRQALFPSMALMRARYKVSSICAVLLLYPWRILSGLVKFMWSMTLVFVKTRRPA